jgi:dihydrodipicolinate synthase/N-acetylneuraminate lyase
MCHPAWAVISGGQKQNHLDMHAYGCDGYMSTFIFFRPEIAKRYWAAIQANDIPAAVTVIREYDNPLFEVLVGTTGSFDAAMHGVFELYGLGGRWRRPPYHSLTDAEMEVLATFLRSKGLLPSG